MYFGTGSKSKNRVEFALLCHVYYVQHICVGWLTATNLRQRTANSEQQRPDQA